MTKLKAIQPKKSRNLMYVQNLDIVLNKFNTKEDYLLYIKKHFSEDEYATIIHNKDVNEDTGQRTADHIHLSLSFKNARTPKSIADIMKDNPQSVEIFSGQYGKQNMFGYLIHATDGASDGGKYEYRIDEVVANFDYKEYMEGVKVGAEENKLELAEIKQLILRGDMILKDFFREGVLGTSYALAGFYADNKNKINNYIESRYTIQMSKMEATNLEIIYIEGSAGSGKTMFAKDYAMKKYGDYFITGSSNDSVQDYLGEPVAIFDDARPSDFNASDWLKMIDPYNNKSSVTSRYYNKYLAVKCIIITTTTPFEEFFVYAKDKGGVDEPVSQFMRRFQAVIKVEREEINNEDYAIGRLYEIKKLKEVKERRVGNSTIEYHHEIKETNGGTIQIKIPETDTSEVVDDIRRHFSV